MADQFDLSYEYYFASDGYVGAAYFYKDLKDWQVQLEVPLGEGCQPDRRVAEQLRRDHRVEEVGEAEAPGIGDVHGRRALRARR